MEGKLGHECGTPLEWVECPHKKKHENLLRLSVFCHMKLELKLMDCNWEGDPHWDLTMLAWISNLQSDNKQMSVVYSPHSLRGFSFLAPRSKTININQRLYFMQIFIFYLMLFFSILGSIQNILHLVSRSS